MSKLLTFDPAHRLTAQEMLKHPFLDELYDPENDDQIIEGEPVRYYDFEFEQYTINKDIIRELILDEVIMANSKEARKINRELRDAHKDGVLEMIYERQDQTKKAEDTAKDDKKESPSEEKKDAQATQPMAQAARGLNIVTTKPADKSDDAVSPSKIVGDTTATSSDQSPGKISMGSGASPVRALPTSFGIGKPTTENPF